ncbi:TetR/AcrR family transcriptional regulator [Vibrio sp. SS-MA-C1-2]|uniref:TetR/AcrR family transcriptional regulator n=1 Tax=Vibrio sp. SS-MA-C1-2 TaxID=2908646 RepID=UPI001F2BB827|nr:TetR/AcrR family transcriptional regulator [Vibrio sp. SS-MA-C1-2]UJF19901.1 TetR/AcrR family transcriptional regulator [Vibrio sp. SS-MA-C1-2]
MKKESTTEKLNRIDHAVEQLLQRRLAHTISIYDIAKEASIATSTIYHHYPNIESLFYTQIEKVFNDFDLVLAEAIEPTKVNVWQDINRMIESSYVTYYRDNRMAQQLLLSQHVFKSIRHADCENDLRLAKEVEAVYRQYFILPALPKQINIFAIALQVADKVYSLSYREYGEISDDLASEAVKVTQAYLGLYLPCYLPRVEVKQESHLT